MAIASVYSLLVSAVRGWMMFWVVRRAGDASAGF
jgi:hypothetical protein